MSQLFFALCSLALGSHFAGVTAQASADEAQTNLTIDSRYLSEQRRLSIHLPKGYGESVETYSVMYVLDGQNRTHDTRYIARYLHRRGQAPGLIIVSIPHTGRRARDYYPFVKGSDTQNPGAARFTQFLAEEVIPLVEARYRTKPHRLLLGHSASGVYVLHSLVTSPDLFQSRMAFSPALHHNKAVLPMIDAFLKTRPPFNTRIYVNVGGNEFAPIREMFNSLRDLIQTHAPEGLRYQFEEHPNDGHKTTPFIGAYSALKAQYAQARPSLAKIKQLADTGQLDHYFDQLSVAFGYRVRPQLDDMMSNWQYFYFQTGNKGTSARILAYLETQFPGQLHKGNLSFLRHWEQHGMGETYPVKGLPPEDAFVNHFAYAYLGQGQLAEAIYLFEQNIRFHPTSANAYDSLGEACEAAGEYERALQNYGKAVSLAGKSSVRDLKVFEANYHRLNKRLEKK